MRLRVMTYNIKTGRHHPDGLEAVARIIERFAPDLLGLQELDEGTTRSTPAAQTDWLTRRLYMRGIYAPAMEMYGGQYGIALLARGQIVAHERRLLYRPVYADAISRPRHDSEQRVMLGAVVAPTPTLPRETGEGVTSIKVIVTHLGLTPDQRAVQVQQLAEFGRVWQGDHPTIIMGDFNCDPDAPELAPLHEDFQEACAVCGVAGEVRYTFPSGALGARTADRWRGAIDYVWASRDVRIVSAQVVADESQASDHQPLVVEVDV